MSRLVAQPKITQLAALGAAWCIGLSFTQPTWASNFDGLPAPLASLPVRIERPPVWFQAGAMYSLHTMPSAEIVDVCHALGAASAGLACGRSGIVYMPNPCEFRGDRYAELLCHEQAHAEGWPANHPEGR